MNNKAIPTLLIATIMIAGAFAFMPVQEASTVHTTTSGATDQLKVITATATGAVIEGGATTNFTCATGCIIHGISISTVTDTSDEEANIAIDAILIDGGAVETEIFDMTAGADLVDVNIFTTVTAAMNVADAQTESRPPYFVENDAAIPLLDVAGTWAAADSVTIKFLITEGADNTATATITG